MPPHPELPSPPGRRELSPSPPPRKPEGWGAWISWLELGLIVALAPWFVFPNPVLTPWLMLIPLFLWFVRWLVTGRLTVVTPLNVPLGVLVIALGVSARATYNIQHSFPKIAGVFYGIVVAFALSNHVRKHRAFATVALGLYAAGVAIAAVALLGTRWGTGGKLPGLDTVLAGLYAALPPAIRGLPRAEEGFNTNQIGGTLALLVPLQASLCLYTFRLRRGLRSLLLSVSASLGLSITALVLLLSLSRTAVAATTGMLWVLCLIALRRPREPGSPGLPVVPKALILAGVVLMTGAAVSFLLVLGEQGSPDEIRTLAGRTEIWQRAWTVVRDHAWIGIGFDTLPPVVHARYPTFLLKPDSQFTHAHNIFLQVALDLGVPGLVGFIALLLTASACLLDATRRAPDTLRGALALGILLGLGAYTLFGLADAIALGQKPALLLWVYIGVAGAMATSAGSHQVADENRPRG